MIYTPLKLWVEVQDKEGDYLTLRKEILFGPCRSRRYEAYAQNETDVSLRVVRDGGARKVALYKTPHTPRSEFLFRQSLGDLFHVGANETISIKAGNIRTHLTVFEDILGHPIWTRTHSAVPSRESSKAEDMLAVDGGKMRFRCVACNEDIRHVVIIAGGKDVHVGGQELPEWRYCSWNCRLADNTPEEHVEKLKFNLILEGKMP